jgi:hypothetical protein
MGDSIKKYEEIERQKLQPPKEGGSMSGIGIMQQINRSNTYLYASQAGTRAFDDALKTLANVEWPMTPDEAFKKEEKRCPRRKLF